MTKVIQHGLKMQWNTTIPLLEGLKLKTEHWHSLEQAMSADTAKIAYL
jgi:hypothetical protein